MVVKENLLIRPATAALHLFGQWEGYTHQASLIYWNEKVSVPSLIAHLHDLLKDAPGLSLGLSSLPVNGLLVRMLGNSAEQLFDLFQRVAAFICQQKLLRQTKIEPLKTVTHAG